MSDPVLNISQTLYGKNNPYAPFNNARNKALSVAINNKYSMLINSGVLKHIKPLIYKELSGSLQPTDITYPDQVDEDRYLFQANEGQTLFTRFGSPIFCNTILKSQDDLNYINLDASVININYRKNIIKTKIAGRKGTFKEYISDDDYSISITGLLVNDDLQNYPEELVKAFNDVIMINETLVVLNPILQILGVDSLVIEDVKFPPSRGFENTQPYEIQAVSDTSFELEYSEQQ